MEFERRSGSQHSQTAEKGADLAFVRFAFEHLDRPDVIGRAIAAERATRTSLEERYGGLVPEALSTRLTAELLDLFERRYHPGVLRKDPDAWLRVGQSAPPRQRRVRIWIAGRLRFSGVYLADIGAHLGGLSRKSVRRLLDEAQHAVATDFLARAAEPAVPVAAGGSADDGSLLYFPVARGQDDAQHVDVCIVGGGVAGLMLQWKLAELGYSVVLVEQAPRLASGPSTRNEGWLHNGTYHSTSIADRPTAMQVARRCMYGHEQIRRIAPEAIEDGDLPAFALVRQPDRVAEVVSRWTEAGVPHQAVSRSTLLAAVPEAAGTDYAAAFAVRDVSINTRLLYQKLVSTGRQAGARIITESRVCFDGADRADIVDEGGRVHSRIQARLFIYAAGYGVKQLFVEQFGVELPLRFWKSHLLVTRRLARHGVFFVDPREAAMIHHGTTTITGLNEDAVQCEGPDYQVMSQGIHDIRAALPRLIALPRLYANLPVACIKVDFDRTANGARSLSSAIDEPIPGHIVVLPGKMTEAPFVADQLTRHVFDRLDSPAIARRPCDTWDDEAMGRRAA